MNNNTLATLGIVVGAVALVVALTKKAEAAPGAYIPTEDDIYAAQSLTELDSYYELLNELYISGQIDGDRYANFYGAYEARFYELMEEES